MKGGRGATERGGRGGHWGTLGGSEDGTITMNITLHRHSRLTGEACVVTAVAVAGTVSKLRGLNSLALGSSLNFRMALSARSNVNWLQMDQNGIRYVYL